MGELTQSIVFTSPLLASYSPIKLSYYVLHEIGLSSDFMPLKTYFYQNEIASNPTLFHNSKHPFRLNEWSFPFKFLQFSKFKCDHFWWISIAFYPFLFLKKSYVLQILTPVLQSLLDPKLPETRISED